MDSLGLCDPSSVVMIGDDIRDDIIGATTFGMQGILVKTGKYYHGDENFDNKIYNTCTCFADYVDKLLLSI